MRAGEMVICLSEFGWTPGCVTVGKTYKVISQSEYLSLDPDPDIMIIGNDGLPYKTSLWDGLRKKFMLLSEYREIEINKILNE